MTSRGIIKNVSKPLIACSKGTKNEKFANYGTVVPSGNFISPVAPVSE
jgi:hypothetical protein